ncbi:MAG: glycosyltransferase family 4 protein [Gammaproteobacteria bacterium]|nr:glycosyltransferase family 4 protein [Gammaproteobacteria bacterium]
MDSCYIVLFWGATFGMSCCLTWAIRVRALKINRLDLPNERSSHVIPTPRGGGVAFVVTFLLGLLFMSWWYSAQSGLFTALAILGLGLGTVGWLDDRFHLSALVRLIVQFLSASLALYCIDFFHMMNLSMGLFAVFYLVSLINIFNFLDGIDGYAVMESCFVAMVMAIVSGLNVMGLLLGCFIASVMGFGVWNFPRAKIFMGDAGSGFLGGVLGLFSLYGSFFIPHFFWMSVMLMGVFIADAGLTITIRLLNKEQIWKAHRQHAYQHLAIYVKSHPKVTLGAFLVNLFWILPLVMVVRYHDDWVMVGVLMTYVPLLILACYWGAGRKTL